MSLESMSPMNLFQDITYLGHGKEAEECKGRIEKACLAHPGYIAFIDYDNELGWVFHTLLTPDGLKSAKPVSERFEKMDSYSRAEFKLEDEVCNFLKKAGQRPKRQVRLMSGRADIVTDTTVYELKDVLSRDKLFQAIGQVLIYRQEISPNHKAVVVGRPDSENVRDIVALARQLGVEIWEWKTK